MTNPNALQWFKRRRGGAAALVPLDDLTPSLLLDERGASISAWPNQGSAGGTADQATGANQPTLTTINGLAALDFDGTDDWQLTTAIASALVTTSALSGIVVMKPAAAPASTPVGDATWYNGVGVVACSSSSSFGITLTRDGVRFGRGGTYSATFHAPLYVDSLPHVVRFRLESGAMAISVDGGRWRSTTAANVSPLTGGIRVGANFSAAQRYNGDIGTVMLKGAALTSQQWSDALAYLAAKYGVISTPCVDYMWIGDSITAHTLATMAQWRGRVQSVAGNAYRATGIRIGAGVAFAQDNAFAGGGQTTAALAADIAANGVSTRYKADVCPILLGTNDIAVDGVSNATLATRYGAMLDNLQSVMPGALYVCQKIMPRGDGFNAQVTDWNDNYHATMVADAVTRGINAISDDTFATLPGISYIDSVHPAAASGNLMGDAITAKIPTWSALA